MENDRFHKLVSNKKTTFNFHISFTKGPTADSSEKQCKGRNKACRVGNHFPYCTPCKQVVIGLDESIVSGPKG